MSFKCRFPGCTVEMQTSHGQEMHETICHGLRGMWITEEVFAQVQAQSGLAGVDVPLSTQIAFKQDMIIIEKAVDNLENTCCC